MDTETLTFIFLAAEILDNYLQIIEENVVIGKMKCKIIRFTFRIMRSGILVILYRFCYLFS